MRGQDSEPRKRLVCRKSGKVGEHGVTDTDDFVGVMARSRGGYFMASVFQGK